MLNFGYDNLIETPEQRENSFSTTWSEAPKTIFIISSSVDRRHSAPVGNVNNQQHRHSTIIESAKYEILHISFPCAVLKLLFIVVIRMADEILCHICFCDNKTTIHSTHLLLCICQLYYISQLIKRFLWSFHYLIHALLILQCRIVNSVHPRWRVEWENSFVTSYYIQNRGPGCICASCDWWWIYTKNVHLPNTQFMISIVDFTRFFFLLYYTLTSIIKILPLFSNTTRN